MSNTAIEAARVAKTMAYPDIAFYAYLNGKDTIPMDHVKLDGNPVSMKFSPIPEILPAPMELPIVMEQDVPTPVQVATPTETIEAPQITSGRSLLLDLPLEIRLQIYSHLLPANHAKHAHLSPSVSYPPATSSAYFLRALSTSFTLNFPNFEPAGKSEPTLFSDLARFSSGARGHGCGFIPSALLASCKQVYSEARGLPWEQNEYVFINWFCSGVYAARAFLRSLKPWQRTGMRWARVEVLGRDLKDSWVATIVGGRAGGGEWKDLCALWAGDENDSGLWGLRLGIKGRVATNVVNVAIDGSGGECDPTKAKDRGVLDVDAEWVVGGLTQMKGLRWLELDIEDEEIERDDKVAFCLELGKKLSSGSDRKIEVLFVEKVVDTAAKAKHDAVEEMTWGEPGEEYMFGLDS